MSTLNASIVYSKDNPNCHKAVSRTLFAATDPSCLNCARLMCPKGTVLAAGRCGLGYNWGMDKLCADYWPDFDKIRSNEDG